MVLVSCKNGLSHFDQLGARGEGAVVGCRLCTMRGCGVGAGGGGGGGVYRVTTSIIQIFAMAYDFSTSII